MLHYMNRKVPTLTSAQPHLPANSPKARAYAEEGFIAWVHEAMEAAYLGADEFERYFNIAGERMLCRVSFYWTDKADQRPRIGRLECIPMSLTDDDY